MTQLFRRLLINLDSFDKRVWQAKLVPGLRLKLTYIFLAHPTKLTLVTVDSFTVVTVTTSVVQFTYVTLVKVK